MSEQRFFLALIASAATFLGCIPSISQAGVSYQNPAGGWRYTYEGTFNPGRMDGAPGSGNDYFIGDFAPDGWGDKDDREALDGNWDHGQLDRWDGTAPGDPLSDPTMSPSPGNSLTGNQGTSPGGAGAFVDGSTNYIRVQDAGNPQVHGWRESFDDPNTTGPLDPINSNRRVFFGHDMTQDGSLDELVLSGTGITISFRMRIPNSGPIDDLYLETDGDDADTLPDVVPWFQDAPNGRGTPMTNGRGAVNVSQNALDNVDTMVSFSLVNSTDIINFCAGSSGALCSGSGSGGLIMNNLNGDVPSNLIDSESGGTLNMLEIGDNELNEWNEFWITMENNAGLPGNIQVKVYMNGSLTPSTFQVTLAANNNSAYAAEDNPYLEFGISDNAGFGSFDMDFLSYQIGVLSPVAAPIENADFDNDGDVDGRDFLVWQRGGSPNGINSGDLALWQTQYGTIPPLTAAITSVPEPSALALCLLAVILRTFPRRGGVARDSKTSI